MIAEWFDAVILENGYKTKIFYARLDDREIIKGDIFYFSDGDKICEGYVKKIINGVFYMKILRKNPQNLINGPSLSVLMK